MTQLEKVLDTARVHTTRVTCTDDGKLKVQLSVPGTPGAGTNPEQRLAAGWSALKALSQQAEAHHV